MTTTLAPPLLRQHVVELCTEMRQYADLRTALRDALLDTPGDALSYAVLYAAHEAPGKAEHVAQAVDRIGAAAAAIDDRSWHEHERRCDFAAGFAACDECTDHYAQQLDEALDHLLDVVLSPQAVADLRTAVGA